MTERNSYLTIFLLGTVLLFACTWVLTSELRRGFLEPEYGVWQAKLAMIDRCDLGDTVVLGDSRASAAFIPEALHANVRNFALSGTGPIEADFELRRMFRCPHLPKVAIISFSPHQFEHVAWFWRRSARFDLLSYQNLEEIRELEQQRAPGFLYRSTFGSEPPGPVKNWLYIHHFPPYEFADLIGSAVIGRLSTNNHAYHDTLASQGQHPVGNFLKCAVEPDLEIEPQFSAAPLIDAYFDRLLADLTSHGIRILIIPTPMSEISAGKMSETFERQYGAYLSQHSSGRYAVPPIAQLFPVTSNCSFGDNVHLNLRGAAAFSTKIGGQLKAPG